MREISFRKETPEVWEQSWQLEVHLVQAKDLSLNQEVPEQVLRKHPRRECGLALDPFSLHLPLAQLGCRRWAWVTTRASHRRLAGWMISARHSGAVRVTLSLTPRCVSCVACSLRPWWQIIARFTHTNLSSFLSAVDWESRHCSSWSWGGRGRPYFFNPNVLIAVGNSY